jgi:hypothetical protein
MFQKCTGSGLWVSHEVGQRRPSNKAPRPASSGKFDVQTKERVLPINVHAHAPSLVPRQTEASSLADVREVCQCIQ